MLRSQGRPSAIWRLMIWLPMMEEVANSVFLFLAAMDAFMMSEMLPPHDAMVSPTKVCEMGRMDTRTSTVDMVILRLSETGLLDDGEDVPHDEAEGEQRRLLVVDGLAEHQPEGVRAKHSLTLFPYIFLFSLLILEPIHDPEDAPWLLRFFMRLSSSSSELSISSDDTGW